MEQKIIRTYKDRLFRFLFSEKAAALSLYNAVNGTAYEDPEQLDFVTLGDAIYMGMKNDIAFVLLPDLNLYEQESSVNPNMPLRGLFYLSREYEKLVEREQINVFSHSLQKLPTPKYVVFYNGTQKLPDDMELRLSDAFAHPEEACLEVRAKLYNINAGHNEALLSRCVRLGEYSRFVACVRKKLDEGMSASEAVDSAVEQCINEGILSDILREHRAEVIGMVLNEWDSEKMRKLDREEGRKEGREEGRKEGHEQGHKDGLREGREETLISVLRNLMRNLGKSAEEAMDLMSIPVLEREHLAKLLAEK